MKLTGVLPALFTPLNEDETLNKVALKALIEHLTAQGADGFYVGGGTGEGIMLRREVREELACEAVKLVNHKNPCVIHIASADFNEAIALAKHAEACGADGISAIPPLFYSYAENEVFNYYKTIAEAVSIPLIVYYNPAAGFSVNANFAARLFEVDNITGIKWTSSDYYGVVRLKDLTHGEMNIINGPDEMLLMGLAAGADAGIGTTYNFMLPKFKAIYSNFIKGDINAARNAQIEADRVIFEMLKYPGLPAAKLIMRAQGFDLGECAYPMKRFTEAEQATIIANIKAAGLEI